MRTRADGRIVLLMVCSWLMGLAIGVRYEGRLRAPNGAVILKICHGSTVYRLRDGRIVTGGGYRVENPETVCEAP